MMMYNKKKALMHSILLYKNQEGHVYPDSMVQNQQENLKYRDEPRKHDLLFNFVENLKMYQTA